MSVVLSNVQSASFQRGNVYALNAEDEAKRAFQREFRKCLHELVQRHKTGVTEEEHCQIIEGFAGKLSQCHGAALKDGRLRIGTAQKAINLLLKYLWSLGLIPEPHHCPVDRIVLTNIKCGVNWTQLEDMNEYRRIISCIRQHAAGKSLAQWELDLWDKETSSYWSQ